MKNHWVPARVLEASDRNYSEAVLPRLDRARKEIVLSLYLLDADDTRGPEHPVNRLVESLLRARGRGVHVRIYLNTRFRVRSKADVGLGRYFEKLLQAGVEITGLLPTRRLHDKLIVIDQRYVVEGSTNWSVSALKDNYESNSIIDSPAHAEKKLERIQALTRPRLPSLRKIDTPLLSVPEEVEIPLALFEKNRLPQMVRQSDRRTFDLYLTLLGQAAARGKKEFEVDLETLGQALGLPLDWDRSRVRRQIIKVLRKLENRYQLIEVEFPYGRNAKVKLRDLAGDQIRVPGGLLEAGRLSKESSGTIFLALAREVLKSEGIDIDLLSSPALEKRFGVGQSTIVRARSGR